MSEKRLYLNGSVVTMNPKQPEAAAFGITGNRFCAVGSNDEIRQWANNEAKVVDLNGKTVVPGFIETHTHLSWYGMARQTVDCASPLNRTIEDVKAQIKERVQSTKAGEWVIGQKYDDTLIVERRHLTRYDLDEISPQNPVWVSHVSGHLAYANSMTLDIAGIHPETPQPEGAEIDKDDKGIPTGLLKELGAICLVTQHMPRHTVAELKNFIREAVRYVHRTGVTSVHDAAIGAFRHGPQFLQAYRELAEAGKLNLRVYLTLMEELYWQLIDLGLGTGFGSELVKLGCVKLFQDGSIQGWTGALSEAYHDKPGFKGNLIMKQEILDGLVEKYHKAGLQIAVHANGDAAIESVIRAMEKAQGSFPRQDHRHMIIHCQTASQDHIIRMKKLGVIPSYFVNHVYYWGDRHASIFLGPERASRISPLASSLKAELVFTLHSDLPITPIDPLHSMHNAVNRITREGKMLGEGERISPLEALKAYTIWAAYCSFEENQKGSIEVGKLADFVILSNNPLTVVPDKISAIRVEQTIVDGRKVYESK